MEQWVIEKEKRKKKRKRHHLRGGNKYSFDTYLSMILFTLPRQKNGTQAAIINSLFVQLFDN
jgi:hypothetical protein